MQLVNLLWSLLNSGGGGGGGGGGRGQSPCNLILCIVLLKHSSINGDVKRSTHYSTLPRSESTFSTISLLPKMSFLSAQ